jgi:3-dehydroquinate synthase
MRTVEVKLNQGNYQILIGQGLLITAADNLKQLGSGKRVIMVTHPSVKQLYGDALQNNLKAAGMSPEVLEVPEGEENKSLEQASRLYHELSRLQAERTTTILALGGGVIGDLAGFVAATYMRGMPLVQVPTTLLAQVDSSIGGKTAVNQGKIKNTIGVFYQPSLVIADIAALKTLPENEFVNGMAEIIKYGIIQDEVLFRLLENNVERVKNRDESFLEEIVFRCASIKADVVGKDEKDTGLRNILNFGHTLGHAIETVSDFGIGHGKSVASGMIIASRISRKMGLLSESEFNRIKYIICQYGLPVQTSGWDVKELMQATQYDKKRASGRMRMVLVRKIGEVFISEGVNPNLVQETLEEMDAEA